MMKKYLSSLSLSLSLALIWFPGSVGQPRDPTNSDYFNYGIGLDALELIDDDIDKKVFSQDYWAYVTCKDEQQCTGFPDKFPAVAKQPGLGWSIGNKGNGCKYCPHDMEPKLCGVHRQSPINLKRYPGVRGNPGEKNCTDWHWMWYKDGTCSFDDMKDHFSIERHALQMHVPTRADGTIDCEENGERKFPRLDYSKGFPDWWYLARIDVTTPSQHWQEGYQYAAELTLAHFYMIPHSKNEMGSVTIFLQDYPDAEPWPWLDKLICQWREEEEKARAACNMPPAPPYGRCRLFRDQEPETQAPTSPPPPSPEPSGKPSSSPTSSPPTTKPSAQPTSNPSAEPSSSPSSSPTMSSKNPTIAPTISNKPSGAPFSSDAPSESPTTSQLPSQGPTNSLSPTQSQYPSILPTSSPSEKGTELPSSSPSQSPTSTPSAAPSPGSIAQDIPACEAMAVDEFNRGRMCESSDPCCQNVRTDSNYCWEVYELSFPNMDMREVCGKCCGLNVSPNFFATPKPNLPQTIKCSDYNTQRYCGAGGCCYDHETDFCKEEYDFIESANPNQKVFEQICHYCCSESTHYGDSEAPTSSPTVEPTTKSPTSEPTETDLGDDGIGENVIETDFPTVAPISPTVAPIAPTAAPVAPTGSPIAPTGAPIAPTAAPIAPTGSPIAPTAAPIAPTAAPLAPTANPISPTVAPIGLDVPACNALASRGFNRDRMCFSSDPCCQQVRTDSSFCWETYDLVFPGTDMRETCGKCCGLEVGPNFFATPKPGLPHQIQCSDFNVQRYCKSGGCCDNPNTGFCQAEHNNVEANYPNQNAFDQICHYCCSVSKDYSPPNRRALDHEDAAVDESLRSLQSSGIEQPGETIMNQMTALNEAEKIELVRFSETQLDKDPPKEKGFDTAFTPISNDTLRQYILGGRLFTLTDADLTPDDDEDENEYFNRIYGDFLDRETEHRRRLVDESNFTENYENVHYWPYEPMLKVGTEYYFRYEGTQVVPPCREFVHWRVMKDPIRVHIRQIDELNRLLAERINPDTCNPDTAAVVDNSGPKVRADVSRKHQYYHNGHRKVFCECQDWHSKFPLDNVWCTDWRAYDYKRYYLWPYSFPTYQWLPGVNNTYCQGFPDGVPFPFPDGVPAAYCPSF